MSCSQPSGELGSAQETVRLFLGRFSAPYYLAGGGGGGGGAKGVQNTVFVWGKNGNVMANNSVRKISVLGRL